MKKTDQFVNDTMRLAILSVVSALGIAGAVLVQQGMTALWAANWGVCARMLFAATLAGAATCILWKNRADIAS